MHIKKTITCKNGVDLPYIIKVDNPKYKIGIFGDSFAQLAEDAKNNKKMWQGHTEPLFNHEATWQYFLANLLSVETHSYGISCASMGDISDILLKSNMLYDYYIIFHTQLGRENIFAKEEYNAKIFKQVKNKLIDKKVLNVYWDVKHKIKSFSDRDYISNYHLTHPNLDETEVLKTVKNPLDILGSYGHMSARGNLLLAIELHKIIASSLKF